MIERLIGRLIGRAVGLVVSTCWSFLTRRRRGAGAVALASLVLIVAGLAGFAAGRPGLSSLMLAGELGFFFAFMAYVGGPSDVDRRRASPGWSLVMAFSGLSSLMVLVWAINAASPGLLAAAAALFIVAVAACVLSRRGRGTLPIHA